MENVFIYAIGDDGARVDFDGVERGLVSQCIGGETPPDVLDRVFAEGRCFPWGVPDRGENRSLWSRMAEDDLVLASCGRAVVAAAFVIRTLETTTLAGRLWGGEPDGVCRLVCFSGKPYTGEVPIVPQMERYLDREFAGFTRLDPQKCRNILNDYGSFETFVRLGLMYDFPFSFRHSE